MKNPAAQCSGVLAWVERREVEKSRMVQITAHGFRICMDIIQEYYVETVKKTRTFFIDPITEYFCSWKTSLR